MAAAIAYLETLGMSHGCEEEDAEPASRRASLVRAMNSIREYEATLSFEMLEVLKAAGATIYGIDDPARVWPNAFPHFVSAFQTSRRRSSPRPCRTAALAFATATCTLRD